MDTLSALDPVEQTPTSQPTTEPATASVQRLRAPPDTSSRCPKGWSENMEEIDRRWIGKALFNNKGNTLSEKIQLWYYPPQIYGSSGTPDIYPLFCKPALVWMPYRTFNWEFKCPTCSKPLTSKGAYRNVRLVLNLKSYYYLIGEYMECRESHTFISYDQRLLEQLTSDIRSKFPVTLTRKYALDNSVIAMLRSRTLGNSSHAIANSVLEQHSEDYLAKVQAYLADCSRHKESRARMNQPAFDYRKPPTFKGVPRYQWFLATYLRDVWSRLELIKASITSIYGSVLKIDSTKKICKKLAGDAAKSVNWITNVGNEHGQVLMSVATVSESTAELEKMANGLMERYRNAGVPRPEVMYTDRDCCDMEGNSKLKQLFHQWQGLPVRLDIWHFMRRISVACTSESHPLYGTFMAKLSDAIFIWDSTDFDLLKRAKRNQLTESGVRNVTESAIVKAITSEELARHCKRRTRGILETETAIETLIFTMSEMTDSLGVAVFNDEIKDIWQQQKRHLPCIQDVVGIQLYTVTGHLTKSGIKLPIYRCARGSTSLESFHNHLNR